MRVAGSRSIPHRRFSGIDARALRRAGAMTRAGYVGRLGAFAGAASPAQWQVDPAALLALAKQAAGGKQPLGRLGRLAYFRGFGLSPTADVAASAVGSKVAAAGVSAAATALGAGAAAGPIGLAAGAVVALALTLFQKNYFNVVDANAACAQEEALWQKYLTVQGHVAGRALGWPTMQTLMHAATGAGLFPLNSTHLSFHEGTLQCAGNGAWVDSFLSNGLGGTSCSQNNCMINALQKFKTATVPAGTPDAVYFIDSIVLPMNAGDSIPWINSGASNPTVHQMLYDLADAYLAQNNVASTAYVKYPAASAAAPTSTSTPTASTPTQSAAAPPVPAKILSTDGSYVKGTAAALQNSVGTLMYLGPVVDSAGNRSVWRHPAGASPSQVSTGVLLALWQDNFYLQGAGGNWYEWSGSTWEPSQSPIAAAAATSAAAPAGTTTATSVAAPATSVAAPVGTTTPVSSAPLAASTMSETGATAPAASAPINVTVTAPAASAPAQPANMLLWVAIAGLGALVFLGMSHDKKH
jgi:hypothetical protein